jgi:hypothetical protein
VRGYLFLQERVGKREREMGQFTDEQPDVPPWLWALGVCLVLVLMLLALAGCSGMLSDLGRVFHG